MYSFSRLINKYSRATTVFKDSETTWVGGKPVKGEPTQVVIQLAIIPFDLRTVAQLGGLITSADAQIYSLVELKHGDKIEQNGSKYTVDTSANFTTYGDFYRYIAKGVSSFD